MLDENCFLEKLEEVKTFRHHFIKLLAAIALTNAHENPLLFSVLVPQHC